MKCHVLGFAACLGVLKYFEFYTNLSPRDNGRYFERNSLAVKKSKFKKSTTLGVNWGGGPVFKHPLNDEQNDGHNNNSVKFTIFVSELGAFCFIYTI